VTAVLFNHNLANQSCTTLHCAHTFAVPHFPSRLRCRYWSIFCFHFFTRFAFYPRCDGSLGYLLLLTDYCLVPCLVTFGSLRLGPSLRLRQHLFTYISHVWPFPVPTSFTPHLCASLSLSGSGRFAYISDYVGVFITTYLPLYYHRLFPGSYHPPFPPACTAHTPACLPPAPALHQPLSLSASAFSLSTCHLSLLAQRKTAISFAVHVGMDVEW